MATTSTTPVATSSAPSAQSLSRFNAQAAQQGNQAATNLALLEAETTQAGAGGGTPSQDANPSVQRLSSNQWQGMTSQVNNAQRAQGSPTGGDVWVTVPVDKVSVTPSGAQGIAPVYATAQGYRSKPGESVGSIPPPMAAGR